MQDGLVAGDRLQRHVRKIPRHVGVRTDTAVGLTVIPVGKELRRIEAGYELIAAELDDVGTEQARRAVQYASMYVEQSAQVVAGLVEPWQPGAPVIAAVHTGMCH